MGVEEPMDMEMEPMADSPQGEVPEPGVEAREEAEEGVHDVSMETIDPSANADAENDNVHERDGAEAEQERAETEQGAQQTPPPATTSTTAPGTTTTTTSYRFPVDQLWKHELLEDLLLGFPGFDYLNDWYAGILFPYTVTADLLWNVEFGCLQTWRGMAPLVWRGDKRLLLLRNGQVSRAMELQAVDWLTLAEKFRSYCPRKAKFYLGLATSMLLDSYAPAHVVRDHDGCGPIWQFQNYDAQDPKLHHAADSKFHHKEFPGVWKCARAAVKELLHAHHHRKSIKHLKAIVKDAFRVAPARVEVASGGSLEPFVARQWLQANGVAHDLGATPKDIVDAIDYRYRPHRHLPRRHPDGIDYPKQEHPHFVKPYGPYHKRHHRFLETVARASASAKASKPVFLEEETQTKSTTGAVDAATATADKKTHHHHTKKYWASSGWSSGGWNRWGWGYGWNAWNSWRGWRAPASFFRSAPVLPYSLVPRSIEIRSTLFGRRVPRFFTYDWEEPEYVADEELSIPALCVAQAGPFTADIIRTWDFDLTAKEDELSCELPLYS